MVYVSVPNPDTLEGGDYCPQKIGELGAATSFDVVV